MSNYIMDIRKYVGHRTIIQCGASIICINDCGELLLGRRADNHKWCYSGGSIEIDEKVEDCAKRELLEDVYLCRKYHGQLKKQDEEMEELCFFPIEKIDFEEISPPIRSVLRMYIEQYG